MSAGVSQEVLVTPEVQGFLQRHAGDEALAKALSIARTIFPESRGIEVRLVEDPDEENHAWINVCLTLPLSPASDLLQEHRQRFHEEIERQIALPYHPFSFALSVETGDE